MCLCPYIHKHTHVCMHACNICMYVHILINNCIYICVMCALMDIYTCLPTGTYGSIHTLIYICIHAYVDVCLPTYMFTCNTCIYLYKFMYIMYMSVHTYICHTGVVYDNISIVFMLWASSINNKVGLV